MFGAVKTTHYICRLAQNVFNLSSVKYFSWHPVETIIDSMCCVLSDKNLTASHLSRSNSRPECREIPRKSWLFSLTEKVCDGGKFFAGVTSRGISVRCPWLKIWCSEISMFFFLCVCVCLLTCFSPKQLYNICQNRIVNCDFDSFDNKNTNIGELKGRFTYSVPCQCHAMPFPCHALPLRV